MGNTRYPIAETILALAHGPATEPVAAYLVVWTALSHVAKVVATRAGVRARFALRQNGTLRVRKVGALKMPEVIRPREEHLLSAALETLDADASTRLIAHTAVRYFCRRVPVLGGERVTQDAYRQRPRGVLDVGATLDPRYPVWSFVDAALLQRYLGGEQTAEACQRLLGQIAEVLATIHRNLLGAEEAQQGEANAELATRALPLLTALVEALLAVPPETPVFDDSGVSA